MKEKIKKVYFLIGVTVLMALVGYIVYVNRGKLGSTIMPFAIGGFIAYILHPLVKSLQRRKIPCWLAIVLIYIWFIVLLVLCVMYLVPIIYSNISELTSNIPHYTSEYKDKFVRLQALVNYSNLPDQVKGIVMSQVQGSMARLQEFFLSFLRKSLGAINEVFSLAINIVLGLIVGFYILKDIEYFKVKAQLLVPRKWREAVAAIIREVNVVLSKFIQGQLLISLIVAVIEIIGLSIAGVKYAFILGLIGGLANIIPYFGPFIGAVPAILIALLDSYWKAIFAALVFLIVQQIDNALITPRIMSEKVGMHPLVIIFVVLLGGSFFGALGLILAVPVTAVLKIITKRIIEKMV
jgi:predicted PurR-regulated permease PerM